MWLRTSCLIEVNAPVATPFLLMLRPRSGRHQWVAREEEQLSPSVPAFEFTDPFGNLCQRLVAPAGRFAILTTADIESADAADAMSEMIRIAASLFIAPSTRFASLAERQRISAEPHHRLWPATSACVIARRPTVSLPPVEHIRSGDDECDDGEVWPIACIDLQRWINLHQSLGNTVTSISLGIDHLTARRTSQACIEQSPVATRQRQSQTSSKIHLGRIRWPATQRRQFRLLSMNDSSQVKDGRAPD